MSIVPKYGHYSLSHKYPPKRMFFSSEAADITVSRGDLTYVLRQPIVVDNDTATYMTLSCLTIPNTTYNVNATNNTYSISFTNASSVSYTNTIPIGNYTATSLASALNTSLNACNPPLNCSYMDLTGTLSINSVSLNFALLPTSTSLRVMGFNTSTVAYTTSASVLNSQRVIDLSGNRCFYFTTQIPTENVNFMSSGNGRVSNYLAAIQMQSDTVGVDYYNNTTNFKSKINTNRIDMIHVQLLDDNNNIYIPPHEYTFVLEFEFYDRNDTTDTLLQQLGIKR